MNSLLVLSLFAFAQAPINDDDWTPRPATRGAEPWEMQREKDWIDKRFQKMDTGPFLNCSLEYPHGIDAIRVTRATAIKVGDKGEATMVFDRNLMRWAAGWTGGFLELSDRRFGLLNVGLPAERSKMAFATPAIAGWNGEGKMPASTTRPLPRDQAEYKGLYLNDKRVVLTYDVQGVGVSEWPWYQRIGEFDVLIRNIRVRRHDKPLTFVAQHFTDPMAIEKFDAGKSRGAVCLPKGNAETIRFVALVGSHDASLTFDADQQSGTLRGVAAPNQDNRLYRLMYVHGPRRALPDFFQQTKTIGTEEPMIVNEPPRRGLGLQFPVPTVVRWRPVEMRGKNAEDDAPLVVDTLPVPHDNPFKALMFLTGVDFLSDDYVWTGELPARNIAVTTAHGDVWIVSRVGDKDVSDKIDKLVWRRFATGLYQPLGIKVVDDKAIVVLERGQLTLVTNYERYPEASIYLNLCSDWHVGHGPHSFDTCLQTDAQGNFYFFKTGDTDTPTGGCLMRIDAKTKKAEIKAEIFATGFRHPVGMGMSPSGVLTGADQEGNWMPATRIDLYRKGGFYGDMRAHHRKEPPKTYDPPICWVPHHVDGSAGGQVWVPKGSWGPLSERCLHFSYGRCNMHLLSMEQIGDVPQGGLIDLKTKFTSGVLTGRFNPKDGHLYVAGLRGWQNAAQEDGCLQRVRYTGKPFVMPLDVKVRKNGLELSFSQPLDRVLAEDVKNYRINEWSYRWTKDYGSKRYSVKNPNEMGQDEVTVTAAKMLDETTVLLSVEPLHPVMQMQIGYNLRTRLGQPLVGSVYNTINVVPK